MANEKRLIDLDLAIERAKQSDEIVNSSIWETDEVVEFLEDCPIEDAVEVVHGRWEDESDEYEKGMDLRCLVCGGRADSFVGGTEDWYCLWKPNFCPHCGARMDGDEDDNDT